MANKIYAVKKGLVPGLYNSWDECKAQVNGYSGAEYKSFKSTQLNEAINYVGIENLQVDSNFKRSSNNKKLMPNIDIDICRDFSPAHSDSYTMDTLATTMIKKSNLNKNVDVYVDGSFKNGLTCRIFHDYEGISKWATKEWKCKNQYTKAYLEFIDSNPGIVSEFIHVYGHTGNIYNELADKLAGEAFKKEI